MTNLDQVEEQGQLAASSPEREVVQNLLALDIACEEVERYGMHPDQFIEWYGPTDGKVVCFVHGGYFHEDGTLGYLRPAALALAEAGYRVALVEYRFIDGAPELSLEDVAALTRHPQLANAIWLGHSAGSILVFHAIFNEELAPKHGVVLAPIFDLRRDVEEFQKDTPSVLARWIGGSPTAIPDVYAQLDPAVQYARLGADAFSRLGLRLDMIHGVLDRTIPAQRTRELSTEPFNIAMVPDANHVDVIRPGHDAWILLLGALG
ncbi:MAG: hypothetical protein SPG61_06005 [Arcanobacterium sp.]|nr:hypothetical protein [Arcanobacterium sp.]